MQRASHNVITMSIYRWSNLNNTNWFNLGNCTSFLQRWSYTVNYESIGGSILWNDSSFRASFNDVLSYSVYLLFFDDLSFQPLTEIPEILVNFELFQFHGYHVTFFSHSQYHCCFWAHRHDTPQNWRTIYRQFREAVLIQFRYWSDFRNSPLYTCEKQ